MVDLNILENIPLAPLTTFGVGGLAKFFIEVRQVPELTSALKWAHSRSLSFFILGGGSNLVIADHGFPGLAIKMAIRGVDVRTEDDHAVITVGAGENWDNLVARSVREGLAGIECLSGIPGLVGATPIQNVGAYGQEVSQTIRSIEALDASSGKVIMFRAEDCHFGYRSSRFKGSDAGRFIVTAVTYCLKPGGAPTIKYPDLKKALTGLGSVSPSLTAVRDAVLSVRRVKGMVLDADDPDTRGVGSFFVNPIVTAAQLKRIQRRLRDSGIEAELMPVYEAEGGNFKLSAAWLIEAAGFTRGFSIGNARISSKHSLAITNAGSAAAMEIIALANQIRSKVFTTFEVDLHPEPVLIGFETSPL